MKWGRRWSNPWGQDKLVDIRITDFRELPPAMLVSWEAIAEIFLYHVYLDGKFYTTTKATKIVVQCKKFGRHWAEVFLSGSGNDDEDISAFVTTIPGTRVKLSWVASSSEDIHHYMVFWDAGIGGDLVELGETKDTTTEYITEALENGTYVFRIAPVDIAGNQFTSGATETIVISRYPNPPSDLALADFVSETGQAEFTFSKSDTVNVTGYVIYHNAGSGYIDYETTIITIAADQTSFSLPGLTTGNWKIALRAINANYEEDNVDVFVEFKLGGSPVDLFDEQPNAPLALVVRPAANGTFDLYCTYDAYEELGKATNINFYADNGLGGVIENLVATTTVGEHTRADMAFFEITTTSSALVHGRTYNFLARAVTENGQESEDSNIAIGVADAIPPSDISNLVTEAVNYEE